MSLSLRLVNFESAHCPRIATPGSAAADLRAVLDEPLTIYKGTGARISTGVTAKLSQDHCALILPRSGLAGAPHFLTIPNAPGLIDADFRGEIFINLFCLGSKITIKPGDRIAQILCVRKEDITGHVTHGYDERGTGGAGSTGVQ